MHSILGEKITFLVQEFAKNPQPFIVHHKANASFTHYLYDTTHYGQSDEDFIEVSIDGRILITTGSYVDTLSNTRWHWSSALDDLLIFAPNSTDVNVKYDLAFTESHSWKYDEIDYSEEQMFQYLTVLSNRAYETLELYQYLKKHCPIAFKINLLSFDLDSSLEVYGYGSR